MSAVDVTRVAVISCPDWQAVAAQCELQSRSRHEPCVAVLHAQRVVARTDGAASRGVLIGMRRREAQAVCPELHIAAHNPERDRLMFEPVVRAVGELVPLVEVSTPGVILLATRGPSRYVGGDEVLAARLHAIAQSALADISAGVQIPFGVSIADGRLTAMIAAAQSARNREPVVIAVGQSVQCLAQLPVAVLSDFAEVDRGVVSLLQRLGLAFLADIVAVKPAVLIGRFGPVGHEMHRLASGLDRNPPITVAPPPEHASTHRFDAPVEDVNTIVYVARGITDELVGHLGAHGASCVRLHICMQTDHGEQTDRVWYQPEGLSAAAMAERVRWQMEAWVAARGVTSGVVLLRFNPVGLRAREGRQLGLWGGTTQADEWAVRAIERLTAMLGAESVQVAQWRGGRDPAEVFALTAASLVDLEHRGEPSSVGERAWLGALPSPSPSRVYDEPVSVLVLDADYKPLTVSGRHELSAPPAQIKIDQRVYDVISWAGPWPVEERWWDPLRQRRMVRMQLVITRNTLPQALLLVLEFGKWWVAASYA